MIDYILTLDIYNKDITQCVEFILAYVFSLMGFMGWMSSATKLS